MSEKVEVPETPKSVTFENELKKELEEIDNYQNLNENQKNLLEAICEFTTILKFDIWDENNHSSRGLKSLSTIMQLMDEQILEIFVNWFFKNSSVDLKIIAKHISTFTEDQQVLENPKSYENPNRVAFCFLICLLFHIRLLKKNQNNRAIVLCDILMDFLQRRSMDISPIFSAKICSLINRVYDILGRSHALIKFWFYMLNIHELLHYDESYATLVNLIVRSYIRSNLWLQGENFIKKCKFPQNASNSQQARYSYYCGLICMVHRNYKVALTHFSKSLTSSQNLNAVGLKQTVVRSILLSKLLIGEYPDRKLFLNECYFKGILPYFDLIKAVKLGSHLLFTQYIDKNQDCYIRDHTAAIVLRLHHNVLKAALVRLSLSYSSIYLTDIAKKLSLDNNDVEFIVAKAIKDNIVNALIDHDLSIANFKTEDNVYNTHKPQKLLQSRSTECYNLYSKFMTSMTYPKSAYTFDAKLEEAGDDLSDMEFLLRTYEEDLF